MKTFGEIIEAAKSGDRPDYDDLRLSITIKLTIGPGRGDVVSGACTRTLSDR